MAVTVKDRFKKDSVAIISENADYGQQLLKGFKEKADEIGIKVVNESVVTPGQDIDFKSILLKAKAENPGMLLIFVTYNEGGMLVNRITSYNVCYTKLLRAAPIAQRPRTRSQ